MNNIHNIRIQAISLLFLSAFQAASLSGEGQAMDVKCAIQSSLKVLPETFLAPADTYLDSYKTDACRNLCGSSHKVSVSAVPFSGDWNVSTDFRKTAKYKIIQYRMKLKNIIELVQNCKQHINTVDTTYTYSIMSTSFLLA